MLEETAVFPDQSLGEAKLSRRRSNQSIATLNHVRAQPASRSMLYIGPIAIFAIVATFLINNFNFDVWFASFFFDSSTKGWTGDGNSFWTFIYDYTAIPAIALVSFGGIQFLRGILQRQLNLRSQLGGYLILGLALGPGLIVNGILKENVGRPRPHQVTHFGGEHTFAKVGQLGHIPINSSFPSGHASMGFYLMLPGILFLNRGNRRLGRLWILLGLSWGCLIGASRILQGDHYFSDILWSGIIVYCTGALLAIAGDFLAVQRKRSPTLEKFLLIFTLWAPVETSSPDTKPVTP